MEFGFGVVKTTGGTRINDNLIKNQNDIKKDHVSVLDMTLDLQGEILYLPSNTTLIGKGSRGKIKNGEIIINNEKNIIICDILFENVTLVIKNQSHNVFATHCEFRNKFHNNLIINESSLITISYSKFFSYKNIKILSFDVNCKVTLNNNYFSGSNNIVTSNNCYTHIINNYFESKALCIDSINSTVFSEYNVFFNSPKCFRRQGVNAFFSSKNEYFHYMPDQYLSESDEDETAELIAKNIKTPNNYYDYVKNTSNSSNLKHFFDYCGIFAAADKSETISNLSDSSLELSDNSTNAIVAKKSINKCCIIS